MSVAEIGLLHGRYVRLTDRFKAVTPLLNTAQAAEAAQALSLSELAVERTTTSLLRADDRISASHLRRFFEKLKRQDESIVHFLIKFYLYAGAVDGDRRDKVDFLFTRIGEEFVRSLEIRALRDEIQSAEALEELTERSLLKNARAFKHALGDLYFHPDVLLAIVE